MKNTKRIPGWVFITLVLMAGSLSHAGPERNADKTLSPYFLIKSNDPGVDQLPLKSTAAEVNISGVIADVRVTQVYKNEGQKAIEAVYVFPASTRAAVYGMKMTVGERTITAKIREREQARRDYDQAKQAGKSASLLEQQRPNVFQMSVANILPSDVIKVELKYTELLVPTDAVYEFIYPTVVGPRYVDTPAGDGGASEGWTANPYLHQGESPTYTFDISANISAGLPIQEVSCKSHRTGIEYTGTSFASVRLDPADKHGGNRDFIIKYRLAGSKIETGLLLSEGKDENFFLLMLQPPKSVSERQIPPREYIFIVDVSGSMNGFPLNISKKLLRELIGNLRPTDRFNVLLFAGGSHLMSERSLPATSENILHAMNVIERQRGGGGTRLLPALRKALSLPTAEGTSRSIVIATDGYVSVEEEAFDIIRNNLGKANMFAFGIGSSVNRHLIEGMARVGMGEPFIITRPEEAPKKADRFRKLIASPVLTGITVDYGRFEAYDVEPPSIPDVLTDRPVIVFGKWRGKPQGTISLQGSTGDRPFLKRVDASKSVSSKANSALQYLWARHRIALLSDYNRLRRQDERIKEVTSLGLTYNLMTAYTSFIAVDTQVRLKDGETVTIKQPLPLPRGVSDYAVGGRSLARKAYAPSAGVPWVAGLKSMAMDESAEVTKEGFLVPEPEKDASTVGQRDLELKSVKVSNDISKKTVENIIRKHIPALNLCYQQMSTRLPQLKGKITFRLIVDAAGRVTAVYAGQSAGADKLFEQCMVKNFKILRFPSQKAEQRTVVTVTFILR